ncbi:MAG: hypothetical protein ACE5OZ_03250 [Candidatus Heimdallarchaeota archaeon]
MVIDALLPIISIIGLGMGILYFLSIRFGFKLSKGDFYLIAVLVGEFVLIFSMGIIGILTKDGLWWISRLYFVVASILSASAIYHFVAHNIQQFETFRSPFPKKWTGEHILIILVSIYLAQYFLLLLIYPLWGFDALETYLPNAFYYYQQDSIPKFNVLTVTPTIKAPAHTLLFTYVLYVSGNDVYYLIPYFTLFSLVVVTYKFGEVFLGSSRRGWLAALLLLALPLTRELMTLWAYYQDLYVAFYFAAAIYLFLLAFQRKNTAYSFVSGLAVGLAILAKMSGWTLPFLLILVTPTSRKGQMLKIFLVILVSSWLAMKAAAEIFIGVSVAIALVSFLLMLLIFLIPSENASTKRLTIPLITGVTTGVWWLYYTIISYPEYLDLLLKVYFQTQGSSQWEYPITALQRSALSVERFHSQSFIGTCLILLVSSWFATGWIIPKLLSQLKIQQNSAFTIWCLTFLMIWFGYYFTESIRYLSVILVPMVLLTVAGVQEIYERLLKGKIPLLGLESTLLLLATFQIHPKLFWHSWRGFTDEFVWTSHPLEVSLIFIAAFITILAILVILCNPDIFLNPPFPKNGLNKTLMKRVAVGFLIFTAISTPAEKEINGLRNAGWSPQEYAERSIYEYRPDFQELITAIIDENLPDTSILGVNVPGLEFFVQQPVIDILWGGMSLISPAFQQENVTAGMNLLKDQNIRLIVSLNEKNPYFSQFQAEISPQIYIFDVANNNHYFNRILNNGEFALFRILSYSDFSGFVELYLASSTGKASILGEAEDFRSKEGLSLIAKLDLTNLKWDWAQCIVELNYSTNAGNYTVKRFLEIPFINEFLKINIFKLPPENCSLGNLKIEFSLFDSTRSFTETRIYQARPTMEGFLIHYASGKDMWFIASDWGYEVI